MITSSNNAKVKQVVQWQTKAKERRKDHVFLAEGVRMCEEAPVKSVREVYLTEELEQKLRRNAQNGDTAFWVKLQQTGYETVSPEVFAKMADTQTPQGILTAANTAPRPRHRDTGSGTWWRQRGLPCGQTPARASHSRSRTAGWHRKHSRRQGSRGAQRGVRFRVRSSVMFPLPRHP